MLCRALHNIGVSNFLLRHETRSYGVLLLPKHCQKHIGPMEGNLDKIQKLSSFSSGDRPLLAYKLPCTVELNSDRCAKAMFEERISSKSYSVGIKMC